MQPRAVARHTWSLLPISRPRDGFKAHGHPHHWPRCARSSGSLPPPTPGCARSSRSCNEGTCASAATLVPRGHWPEPEEAERRDWPDRASRVAGSVLRRACVRAHACAAESGGKIQAQRGTSSRTLHPRPCRAIDRRFRPLALPFFVDITSSLSRSQRINRLIFSRHFQHNHRVLLIRGSTDGYVIHVGCWHIPCSWLRYSVSRTICMFIKTRRVKRNFSGKSYAIRTFVPEKRVSVTG